MAGATWLAQQEGLVVAQIGTLFSLCSVTWKEIKTCVEEVGNDEGWMLGCLLGWPVG